MLEGKNIFVAFPNAKVTFMDPFAQWKESAVYMCVSPCRNTEEMRHQQFRPARNQITVRYW